MIRTIITRGYGNGTFNGTIATVALRGYTAGAAATGLNPTAKITFEISQQRYSLLTYQPIRTPEI